MVTVSRAPATLAPFLANTSQINTATPMGAYCMMPETIFIMISARQSKMLYMVVEMVRMRSSWDTFMKDRQRPKTREKKMTWSTVSLTRD